MGCLNHLYFIKIEHYRKMNHLQQVITAVNGFLYYHVGG
jgi:hypothetical protein